MTSEEYLDALSEGLVPVLDKLDTASQQYSDILKGLDLVTSVQGGMIFFLGVIAGILFLMVLWSRFK